jgi:hypothetical protein
LQNDNPLLRVILLMSVMGTADRAGNRVEFPDVDDRLVVPIIAD